MEPLTLALVAAVVLTLGLWANGGFEACVADGPGTVVEAPAAWFSPLRVVGLIVAAGAVVMLTMG